MTIYRGQTYLQKHRFLPRQIKASPPRDLGMVIVIPCHNEPDLLETLESLEACVLPQQAVEVIVVINAGAHHSAEIHAQNQATRKEFEAWNKQPRSLGYHMIWQPELPRKHAGVGLARKIGFDEAVDRLEQVENEAGILVGLDADTTIAKDYLVELERWFRKHVKMEACSIGFAHPLEGERFESAVYQGIVLYELYLRYYVQGLRNANYPLAYHCIGSAMAVRASAYAHQNGMNRRKAGEDYYFLHKYMLKGTLGELRKTLVFPSPRPSQKVPFGTGRAILNWLEGEQTSYSAFDPVAFDQLSCLVERAAEFYTSDSVDLPETAQSFLSERGFFQALPEMRKHSTHTEAFLKRFYRWFDGLKTLQFFHHLRDHFYPNQDLLKGAPLVLEGKVAEGIAASDLLMKYRELQGDESVTY